MEDIVVIGGGLMGSACAWELSNYGEKVLLIEQQDPVYTNGSSFGEARISRSLGSKNNIFSYLQQTSVARTQQLIDCLNAFEGNDNHKMEDIYRTSPVTYFHYNSQQHEVDELIKDQNDVFEFAPDKTKALELFGMSIPDDAMVIREYKTYTGTLNPKVMITKLHQGIKYSGNRVIYNEKVTRLKRVDGHFEIMLSNTITGETKIILSKKVVSAAGPYNSAIMKETASYFKPLISTKRLFLGFFKIDKHNYKNLSAQQKKRFEDFLPVLNYNSEHFYAMIEKYDSDGIPILKVGGHYLRKEIDNLDLIWKSELSTEETGWCKTNATNYLRMLNLPEQLGDMQFLKGFSCVYSLTESEIPYVTNIVNADNDIDSNLVLIGGMSGIGAKGSLAYGWIGANLLLNKTHSSNMYQKTCEAMGSNRLRKDINRINT